MLCLSRWVKCVQFVNKFRFLLCPCHVSVIGCRCWIFRNREQIRLFWLISIIVIWINIERMIKAETLSGNSSCAGSVCS